MSKEGALRGALLAEDEFYLAMQRPDRSLSLGVWFNWYQPGLAREAFLSLNAPNVEERENASR